MLKLNWAAYISQTGTELYDIVKACNIMPEIVVTNNVKKMKPDLFRFFDGSTDIITLPFSPNAYDYLKMGLQSYKLHTLHGYLRIMPKDFLDRLEGKMYNGHPALITEYPELKGLNKQEDVFIYKDKYPNIGSVIHEVIPELDSGKIICSNKLLNTTESIDDAYNMLRYCSLQTWKYFFRNLDVITK